MCGRTACTLAPNEICKACSFPSKSADNTKKSFSYPTWRDHPGDHSYSPSTNISPSTFCPVLIRNASHNKTSSKRVINGNENMKYVIQPMMWGLIPPFYKGESASGHGFKTSNCRIEDIENKKSYKPSLNKGQRCVVLCEGFYEWQTTKGDKTKQPYFIHTQQMEGMEIWNKKEATDQLWSEEGGWKGVQLLKMAGLYSHWTSTEGEKIYSFTIVTMGSGKSFSWLHHRIPAILETVEDVERWLDEPDYRAALARLRNDSRVLSYPVSSLVNNSRNKDANLFFPVSEHKVPESGSSKFLSSWLKSSGGNKNEKDVKKEKDVDSIRGKREMEEETKQVKNGGEQDTKKLKKEEKPKGLMKWLIKE